MTYFLSLAAKGPSILRACFEHSENLVDYLAHMTTAWPIFNETQSGHFASAERSPVIAANAALLCIQGRIGNPSETLVAALLADLGTLFLSPQISRKFRLGFGLKSFEKSELDEYQKHPTMSLVAALSRKIEIPEKIKSMMLGTHDRIGRDGFPYKPSADTVPVESMFIQFSEMAINKQFTKIEKVSKTTDDDVFRELEPTQKTFNITFLDELQKSLNEAS